MWPFAGDLVSIVAANTTLTHLAIHSRVLDVLQREFAFLRTVPLLRSIRHRNRHLRVEIDDTSISAKDAVCNGVRAWTEEVRPALAAVALGLCSADLPTLVMLEIFAQFKHPVLSLRNFDVLMWDAVALVRTAFVKKTG